VSEASQASQVETAKAVPRRHLIGLDLGQQSDPSALAVVEDAEAWMPEEGRWVPHYAVRHLQRWPLKTKFPAVVEDVAKLCRSPKLKDVLLVIDGTGVGAAVGDLFEEADLGGANIRRVIITAGHKVHNDGGTWHVPKKQLVSVLLVLLQAKRLAIAKALPNRDLLVRELGNFKTKISPAMNELYGTWREGEHDDLVLAVALACWAAESTDADTSGAMPFTLESRGLPPIYHDFEGRRLAKGLYLG
jgi:hypothetical protein